MVCCMLVTSECRKEESIKLSGRVPCAILKSVLFHLVKRVDMLRLVPLLSQYISLTYSCMITLVSQSIESSQLSQSH